MVVLVIPKNEEDPIKNEAARVATTFSPLWSRLSTKSCKKYRSLYRKFFKEI